MDFNRSNQSGQAGQTRPTSTPAAAATPVVAKPGVPAGAGNKFVSKVSPTTKIQRYSFIALLLSGTILFVAMILLIVFGTPINREAKLVLGDKYQAVFVNVNGTNGGQVYFGKVTALNSQFIRLSNVFYIQNQAAEGQNASAAYNLVKLGCELHGPTDEMVINRQQVFFWENLKNDGQVALKIAEYKKQNPGEQKCAANSNSTQQSGGTTQSSGNTTAPTPTPTTPTSPTDAKTTKP